MKLVVGQRLPASVGLRFRLNYPHARSMRLPVDVAEAPPPHVSPGHHLRQGQVIRVGIGDSASWVRGKSTGWVRTTKHRAGEDD